MIGLGLPLHGFGLAPFQLGEPSQTPPEDLPPPLYRAFPDWRVADLVLEHEMSLRPAVLLCSLVCGGVVGALTDVELAGVCLGFVRLFICTKDALSANLFRHAIPGLLQPLEQHWPCSV